jgi:hypothetical protein
MKRLSPLRRKQERTVHMLGEGNNPIERLLTKYYEDKQQLIATLSLSSHRETTKQSVSIQNVDLEK